MICQSTIVKVEDGVGFYTWTPLQKTYMLDKMHPQVNTELVDSRSISPEQRKHIYAIFNDIAEATGYDSEETKIVMKYTYYQKTGCEEFSLANCDKTTARKFLEFLIEFCIEQDYPMSESLKDHAPDIGRYVYFCLIHRKCCISGLPADLHHVDAVGSGRDRESIIHEGMRVLPLSRQYHNEAHNLGNESFMEKYKLVPIKLDKYLCEHLGLNSTAS